MNTPEEIALAVLFLLIVVLPLSPLIFHKGTPLGHCRICRQAKLPLIGGECWECRP